MEQIITVAEVKMTVIYTKITVTTEKNDSHSTFVTVVTVTKVKDYGTTKICERKPLK